MIFKTVQDRLEIDELPEAHGLSQLQADYQELIKALNASPAKEISINLKGKDSSSYGILSFLISCGELSVTHSAKISFRNLEDQSLREILKKLGFNREDGYTPKQFREVKPQSIYLSLGEAAIKFADDVKKITGFAGELLLSLCYLIRHPRKLDLKEVLFYMDKSGANAVPIVVMVCFLMGLILAFQGIMQMGRFGLEIFVADLVALAIVRELGPLMVAIICIGRAGSAYAAELGTMKVSEEIDAMSTMGLKPERFLVWPKILALFGAMPFLVIIGNISGIIGGVIIGVSMSDLSLTEYCNRTIASLIPANIVESLLKSLVFAVIIAAVGCFRGFESDRDAKGVGNATTSSVVTGIFLVILADFFVTFTFPQIMALFGVDY